MIYAVRCINVQDAQEQTRKYMKEYKVQIKEIRRHRMIPVIILNSGDELHFVTQFTWRDWCYGRTYKFLGEDELFHGKYPLKNLNDMKIPTKSD